MEGGEGPPNPGMKWFQTAAAGGDRRAERRVVHQASTRSLAIEQVSMNALNATMASHAASWLSVLWIFNEIKP